MKRWHQMGFGKLHRSVVQNILDSGSSRSGDIGMFISLDGRR